MRLIDGLIAAGDSAAEGFSGGPEMCNAGGGELSQSETGDIDFSGSSGAKLSSPHADGRAPTSDPDDRSGISRWS